MADKQRGGARGASHATIRGRPVANVALKIETRSIQHRLDTMQTTQRRGDDMGNASEEKESSSEKEGEASIEEKIVKMIAKMFLRWKMEVHVYESNLNVDELMNWINAMDIKYFDYEEFNEEKNVNFAIIGLKGHVAMWWDDVQEE